MTVAAEKITKPGHRRCGCCGRDLPAAKVTELGQAPGVFICARCALWAARRAQPLSALPRLRLPRFGTRHPGPVAKAARLAIPILPSADLDRTARFYAPLGFSETERHEGYLLLRSAAVELHFTQPAQGRSGECFVHVGDAPTLWKHLRQHGTDGVGDIEDQPYGLREFVVTDPDGNRIRVGSPAC